jgi:phenylacetate-CoA ligase
MYNELTFYPIRISKRTIHAYAKKLNEFKPQYLNGYLSAIWYFAKLLHEYDIELTFRLRGIFLTSENTDVNQRKFIEEFFDTRSMTFYGHSERCVIAEEIQQNKYRFDPYYGFTEKVHIDRNAYSIVSTGFLNYSMPFVRYRTDDVCYPANNNYQIEGKRESTVGLYGANDEFIASTALELENPVFNKITTYQFVQSEKGKADLLVIVSKDFQMSDMEPIRKELNRQTRGIIDINIRIVENLILSKRGKYKRYLSSIGSEQKVF